MKELKSLWSESWEGQLYEEFLKFHPEQERVCDIISGLKQDKLILAKCFTGARENNKALRNIAVRLIAEALRTNKQCKRLVANYVHLDDDDASVLAEMLKENTSISVLDLNNNNIHEQGTIAIAKMLEVNTNIVKLNLQSNIIGRQGVIAIAEMLEQNQSLLALDLRYCFLINEDCEKLAPAICRPGNKLFICHLGDDYGEIFLSDCKAKAKIEKFLGECFDNSRIHFFEDLNKKINDYTPLPNDLNLSIIEYLEPDFKFLKNEKINHSNKNEILKEIRSEKISKAFNDAFICIVFVGFILPAFTIAIIVSLQTFGCLDFDLNGIDTFDYKEFFEGDVKNFFQRKVGDTGLSNGVMIGLVMGGVLVLGLVAYYLNKQQKLRNYVPVEIEEEDVSQQTQCGAV